MPSATRRGADNEEAAAEAAAKAAEAKTGEGQGYLGEPRPLDKGTYHGLVPDTDPIYDSGWRFVMGTYLNPHIKPKKEKGR